MAGKQSHLSDVFRVGQEVKILVPDPGNPEKPTEYVLWMGKPSSVQHEESINKARAKQARVRRVYSNEDSDEYYSLWIQVEELETVDEVADGLLRFEENDFRQQAYNDVLFDENVGSDWGSSGNGYLDLMAAIADRLEWVATHNQELSEDDGHLHIWPEHDEELNKLQTESDKFEEEVANRAEQIKARAQAELLNHSADALRKRLMKKMIDAEAGLAWLQEYRTRQVFFACRFSDDHRKLYFKNPEALWDLPESVRQQLFNAWENLDSKVDDLKNSLSPLLS